MMQELPAELRPRLRVLQIIAVALVMGVLLFGAVVAVMPPSPGGGGGGGAGTAGTGLDLQMMRLICLALAASGVVGGLVIKQAMMRRPASPPLDSDMGMPGASGPAFQRFFGATIVGHALLEGPALFAIVIYLLGRDPIDLAIAGGCVVLMAMLHFPTAGRAIRPLRSADGSPHRG